MLESSNDASRRSSRARPSQTTYGDDYVTGTSREVAGAAKEKQQNVGTSPKPIKNLCSGTVIWAKQPGFPWWPAVVFRSWAAWRRFGLPWPRPETTAEQQQRAANAEYSSGLCKSTSLPLPAPGYCIVHFLGPLLSCEYAVRTDLANE